MKNTMTYREAVSAALKTVTDENVATRLYDLLAILDRSHTRSEAAKAKANEKRKALTAANRAEFVASVTPILRKYLSEDITVKELYEKAKDELPTNCTSARIQNVLLREMASEVVKTETKGKANTYRLA